MILQSDIYFFNIKSECKMSKDFTLRQYESFRMSNSSKIPHPNSSPSQRQTFSQNLMRVKTLPDELYRQSSNASLKADTYTLTNNQRHMNSLEKSSSHNNIQYFELDLKKIIKSNKQERISLVSKQSTSQKQQLSNVFGVFLKRLETIEDSQIDQSLISKLQAHFSNFNGRQYSKLQDLMGLSINQLKKNSINKPKLLEVKTQRGLFDKKYNKYYHRNDHFKCQDKLNQASTMCSKSNKEEAMSNFTCKKMVKTMVDQEGNQFRVTVQKVQ